MDNRPIGVFDSGLGGLTAARKLMEVLPGEDIIYLGDTGRVPYGGRSKETIIKYARQDIAFLLRHNVKAVVVACGTVSTNAMDVIRGEYNIPVFGVVEAAIDSAVRLTKNRRIGIIGTAASVSSGTYDALLKKKDPEIETYSAACPLFVPLVENGRIKRGDTVIETVAREYLLPVKEKGIDTLIMGCTHYPLLENIISDIMGGDVTLISPGAETAKAFAVWLRENDRLSGNTGRGVSRYYVTDSTEGFAGMASLFLETDVTGDVERVSLDTF